VYFGPDFSVGILVGTRREVSLESRAVSGELTDELVGAAHGIVGSEFQRDLAVVSEVDLRDAAGVISGCRPRRF
jgi:hypothetical protein